MQGLDSQTDDRKTVHPFVEKARWAVLGGNNISLRAPSIEDTAKGIRRERDGAVVSWPSVAERVLEYTDVDVVFLDLTGNQDRSARLAALAESKSRTFRSSLVEPFDIWRGDWLAVFNRLVALFEAGEGWFPEPDLGKRYSALLKTIVFETCRPSGRPPRSGDQLLKRLKRSELRTRGGLSAFPRELFDTAINRMTGVAEILGEATTNLNGSWAWEDASVAFVGLEDFEPMFRDILGLMLVLSLTEHLEKPHRQDHSCVVFFDAHSDDIRVLGMEQLFGAAYAYRSGVVVLPEAAESLSRFTRSSFPSLNAAEEACLPSSERTGRT